MDGGVLSIGDNASFNLRSTAFTIPGGIGSAIRSSGSGSFRLTGTTTFTIADHGGTEIELQVGAVSETAAGTGLIKDGAGALALGHVTYTGATTVKDGMLAIGGSTDKAVSKTLVIGDSIGAAGSAVVRLYQHNQLPNDGTVTIRSDGRLALGFTASDGDVFAASDTMGLLSLDGGASVTTGGGTLTLTNNVIVNPSGEVPPATITGNLALDGLIRTFTVANNPSTVDLQIDANISNGGLIKDGAGWMVLTGANTFAGATTVRAGVLQVDGSQPASAVSLTGGTLSGRGTVGPITVSGGTLTPGLRTGSVTLRGGVFAPLLSEGVADALAVTGTVELGGSTLNVTLRGIPAVGAGFKIIDNDGNDAVIGTFAGLSEGAYVTIDGVPLQISYFSGDGNDVVLTRIARIFVTAADAGSPPRVRVFDAETQAQKLNFLAYPASFKGGIRVATADVNGDGFLDIITASGPGTAALVKVFSGAPSSGPVPALLRVLRPYGASKGGAFVTTGDINRDGVPDIITGPGAGVAPLVKVFSGASGALLGAFPAFPASFKKGVTVAAGDVNGDGKLDIIAGMAAGSQPRVRVFDAGTPAQLAGPIGSFLAYPASFKGGVYVAAGDLNGDGAAEIITGPGMGFTPLVKVFTPTTVTTPRIIAAYSNKQKKGVRVGAGDINGDGKADILTALGPAGNAEVRAFNGVSAAAIAAFFAEARSFKKGLFVAGSRSR